VGEQEAGGLDAIFGSPGYFDRLTGHPRNLDRELLPYDAQNNAPVLD
jgi:hypothetical protein